MGKPWPPDAGCQGTLLSRPLGQFLAFRPRLLKKTLPVGNAWKKTEMPLNRNAILSRPVSAKKLLASRLLVTGQGNALLTASQDQGWPRHDSRHAKTRGGQGKAQGKAITKGNSWPLGLGYSLKHYPSVMLEKNTAIPLRQIVIVTGPVGQSMTLSGKETLYRANVGRLALETSHACPSRCNWSEESMHSVRNGVWVVVDFVGIGYSFACAAKSISYNALQ
ncbi:hypothetical protein RHSIM_Rhsim02G0139800 [Rhododendron simsii]|uniref:Uncharacterized protein n=1 Tax=Rhododendron simsii TaxID=118357 RepID=A0A834LX67_RHOSS|nr:hypothetical protein RHSIM_Rhsim02G0139800 [Rhododendron simsii]